MLVTRFLSHYVQLGDCGDRYLLIDRLRDHYADDNTTRMEGLIGTLWFDFGAVIFRVHLVAHTFGEFVKSQLFIQK